jgi:hypothetical protein
MGIQSICKVKASVTPVKPDGTNEAAIVVPYYFRGSGVYKSSSTIATAASIEHIPSDKWQGDMPLTPVADLVRAGIVDRLNVIVQDSTTKKKRMYSLVVDSEQRAAIYDGTGTANIDGADFILPTKTGTKNMGKIVKIRSRTEAYNP